MLAALIELRCRHTTYSKTGEEEEALSQVLPSPSVLRSSSAFLSEKERELGPAVLISLIRRTRSPLKFPPLQRKFLVGGEGAGVALTLQIFAALSRVGRQMANSARIYNVAGSSVWLLGHGLVLPYDKL
jgi:hypothetical protein